MSISCIAGDCDSDPCPATSSGALWSRFPATLAMSAKWGSAGKLYLGLGRHGDPVGLGMRNRRERDGTARSDRRQVRGRQA